jgi:TolB protein
MLLSAVCVAAGCDDGPTPPGGSRPVAIMFESDRPEGYGLHLMSADGRHVVALAHGDGEARTGDWSPDGRRIAFTWLKSRTGMEIWLVNADGSGLTQLTESNGSQEPRWSPDGRTISYMNADDPFDWGINLVNLDRTGVRRLPNTAHADGPHDWSPDGTRVVFQRSEAVPVPGTSEYRSVPSLFVADVAGSAVVRLTRNTGCGDVHPAWSPDGTTIAYASCADNKVAIHVVGVDGTAPAALTSGSGIDYRPTWSPDGRQIAFQSERSGNLDVWLISADGSNAVNLTAGNPKVDRAPRWRRSPGPT